MSLLTVYSDENKEIVYINTSDFTQIKQVLSEVGVSFERWTLNKHLAENADNETIINAYQDEINQLIKTRGYQSYDVVSMNPDHPQKAEFRQKFLSEHTHNEDEIRFFVRGQGLFVMHIGDKVYSVLCTQDDLISVPALTKHWFDMGPNPQFTAIRIFDNPEGWVAHFTQDDIADHFPNLEN